MIRSVILAIAVIAIPFGVTAQNNATSELNLGSFSVRPDSARNSPTVEVDLVLVIETGNVRHYRLDRRLTDRKGSITAQSADSRTCPSVLEQFAKVEEIPMPTLVAPGSKRPQSATIMLHATNYTLAMGGYESVSKTGARIELRAQSGSPLARWTEETLEALEPCWSKPDDAVIAD